jgi:tetratricopeptide (TPR) repeat protein
MNKKDLDFEIEFLERLLEKKPDFVEALIVLGEDYTKKGLYEKGLAADTKLAVLRPDDQTVYYNLACDYSLLKNSELSFQALEKAIALGYDDFRHMLKDPDLEYIRQDKRYAQLLSGKICKKRAI